MANCLLSLVTLAVTLFVCCDSGPLEEKLHTKLFSSYKKYVRPGRYHGDTVVVKFGLGLMNIGDVVHEKEEVEFNYRARISWTDYRLQWDARDYNTSTTRIPSDWLWKPDITLYSSANDEDYFLMERGQHHGTGPLAVLDYSGEVLFVLPTTSRVRCEFESQEGNFRCTMKFGSWTMDGFMLQLANYDENQLVDLESYRDKNWNIRDSSIRKVTKYYPCCMEPYLHMEVNVTLSPTHGGN